MTKYDELKAEHQALLTKVEAGEDAPQLVDAVKAYLDKARVQAEAISSPRDRDQLRANLRFWASFVFDKTGVYPDTNLRPPLQAAPSGVRQKISWLIGALIVLPILVFCVILFALLSIFIPIATPTQAALQTQIAFTPEGTFTPTRLAITGTRLPTVIGGGTFTPTRSAITATPTLIRQFTATLPSTDSGSIIVADIVTPKETSNCQSRVVKVSFAVSGKPEDNQLVGTKLSLKPAGANVNDRSVLTHTVTRPADVITLDLTQSGTDTSATYSLQLDHLSLKFSDIIVQFEENCSRNQVAILYDAKGISPLPTPEPRKASDLELTWNLITWGPSPRRNGWAAKLRLQASGGNGQYIFWTGSSPLIEPEIIIEGNACEPAMQFIGVSSGGKSLTRTIVLQSPYCPALLSTPAATQTPTATLTPSKTRAAFDFVVQEGNPIALANAFNSKGCSWMGVVGQAFDLNLNPRIGLIVHVEGDGLSIDALTGSKPAVGPAGYEIQISDHPIQTSGIYKVQMRDTGGATLSDFVILGTSSSCDKNAILLNFIQAR